MHRLALAAGLLALAVGSRANAAEPRKAAPRFHVVNTSVDGVRLELELNGVPVYSSGEGPSSTHAGRITRWLKPGKNALVARVSALPGVAAGSRRAAAYVNVATQGQMSDEGPKLASMSWKDGDAQKPPFEKTLEFVVKDAKPSEIWQKADVLTDDAETRAGALGLYATVAQAYEKLDAGKIAELAEFWVNEERRAGGEANLARAEIREMLGGMLSELPAKKASFHALEQGAVVLRLAAGGRLALLTGKDGAPLLTTGKIKGEDGGEESISMSGFAMARIGGKWVWAGHGVGD